MGNHCSAGLQLERFALCVVGASFLTNTCEGTWGRQMLFFLYTGEDWEHLATWRTLLILKLKNKLLLGLSMPE